MSTGDTAVVYLARKAEGLAPVERFVASYLAHHAGEPHDLIVVFKGYGLADPEFAAIIGVLDAVPYRAFHIDDSGIDITAYSRAAEKLDHRYVCFLNTFSEIAGTGWLAKLASNLRRPGVGLVGTTGSYESLYSSIHLLSKAQWLCYTMKVAYDDDLARYYSYWIKQIARDWLERSPGNLLSQMMHSWDSKTNYARYNKRYEHYWTLCTDPGGSAAWLSQFPRFPNPHIRSNGFMIARQRLLGFAFPKVISKEDGCRFESGPQSLTTYVRSLGLSALVVGKDGKGYDIKGWPSSRTFRLGNQDNLLIADNQVRAFDNHSAEARAVHVFMTWGDYVRQDVAGFPTLDIRFDRSPALLPIQPLSAVA